jgi:hypothetical protein
MFLSVATASAAAVLLGDRKLCYKACFREGLRPALVPPPLNGRRLSPDSRRFIGASAISESLMLTTALRLPDVRLPSMDLR